MLTQALIKLGYQPLKTDPCVFKHPNTRIFIVVYVDDMLFIGPKGTVFDRAKEDLKKTFEMDDMGEAAYFVGVRITRDRQEKTISLCQDAYAKKILERFGMENCNPVATPMAAGAMEYLVTNKRQATNEETKLYQSIVGSINYLAWQTRPDLIWICGKLAKFNVNPSKQHLKAAKRVLQYIKGTIYYCIVLGLGGSGKMGWRLHGYVDSDYAGDLETRKSNYGWVFYFAGGVISAGSKMFECMANSSTEAEFYALGKAAMEAAFLRYFFEEIGYTGEDAKKVLLYGDNQGSMLIAENPTSSHSRTKHIAVKYFYVREELESEHLELWYINTTEMAADGFTKGLGEVKHKEFVKLLNLQVLNLQIQEDL
jgi:hypothetical protein